MCRLSSRVISSMMRRSSGCVASCADALEDVHRQALEEELLGGDQVERVVDREQRVEHHLGAGVDVLDLLAHRVDEAPVREVVPRLVHRLRGGVVAVVLLAQHEDELGAHVLRDALAHLEDVEHAAEGAPRGVAPSPARAAPGRSASSRTRPNSWADERVVGRDRACRQSTSRSKSQSAECALANSELMPGWPVFRSCQELARSHRAVP